MYAWISRHLPGPAVVKALQCLMLILTAVALLYFVMFPWMESWLPFDRVGVG